MFSVLFSSLGAPVEARGGLELLAAEGAALAYAAHAHVTERVPARVDEHVDLSRVRVSVRAWG